MDLEPNLHEERWSRAVAAAQLVALALERDLPHMALAATREAARSALLVQGKGPRRLAGPDLALLRELAAAPPQHMAGRPAERQALVRAALSVLDRLLLPPPGAGWRLPPRGAGATGIDGVGGVGGPPGGLGPPRRPSPREGPSSWA